MAQYPVTTEDGTRTTGVVDVPSGGGSTGTMAVLLSSTEVDLNEGAQAKQSLFTCPLSRRCIPTEIVLHDVSSAPAVAFISIGWNSGADDVVSELRFANISGPQTTQAFILSMQTAADANTLMSYKPAVGIADDILGVVVYTPEGSPCTCRFDVFGYLTDEAGVPVANVLVP